MTAVHHKGRKSGREYVTPVWAERVGQSFYIQLPYGTDVDWCHNVLADDGCTLENDGVRYDAVAPAIVPAAERYDSCRQDCGGCNAWPLSNRISGWTPPPAKERATKAG
jgi:hypothetical protein